VTARPDCPTCGRDLTDRDAALRAEGRQEASDAIAAHIRKQLPPPEKRNAAQRTYARHLDIAVRVAAPKLTPDERMAAVVEAIKEGRFMVCRNLEPGGEGWA